MSIFKPGESSESIGDKIDKVRQSIISAGRERREVPSFAEQRFKRRLATRNRLRNRLEN